jgi:cytochrome c peroxidase
VERNDLDARRVRREIARMEQQGLAEMQQPGLTPADAAVVLGKLIIHDTSLSALQNRACASCHVRETGFTGGISIFNQENVAYPGTVVHRSSMRKPMSYAYAPFAPTLHYDQSQGDFVGGNFWDMRATGHKTGYPAGDQAQDPPVDGGELGLPDSGCVIYRIENGPYRQLFARVWGSQSFDVAFPANTRSICARPYSGSDPQPHLLALDPASRHQVERDYDGFGVAAVLYEASSEVSPFSSKFDRVLVGKASLTPQELLGYRLFTGKANCANCHDASGAHPLFTSYMTANIGTPRNPDLPFLYEDVPDRRGYVANPEGSTYVDNGVGDYLSGQQPGSTRPTAAEQKLAPLFEGRFQVQTVRNVAKRPYASFVRDYTHNGFFKGLKSLVHFYNTRDVLPRCTEKNPEDGDGQVGVSCWPAPEQPKNENKALVGNLGLSDGEEEAIVAFLGTLSDHDEDGPKN